MLEKKRQTEVIETMIADLNVKQHKVNTLFDGLIQKELLTQEQVDKIFRIKVEAPMTDIRLAQPLEVMEIDIRDYIQHSIDWLSVVRDNPDKFKLLARGHYPWYDQQFFAPTLYVKGEQFTRIESESGILSLAPGNSNDYLDKGYRAAKGLLSLDEEILFPELESISMDKNKDVRIRVNAAKVMALRTGSIVNLIGLMYGIEKLSDEDRSYAIKTVAEISSEIAPPLLEELIQALFTILSDKATSDIVRIAIIDTLGDLREERPADILINIIYNIDNADMIRVAAANALMKMEGVPQLYGLLYMERYEILSKIDKRELVNFIEVVIARDDSRSSEMVRNSFKLLAELDSEFTLELLIKLFDGTNIIDIYSSKTFSNDPEIVELALKALVKTSSGEARGILEKGLNVAIETKDNERVSLMIRALGDLGFVESFEAISKHEKDKDLGIRASAAYSLGKIKDIRSVKTLYAMLKSEKPTEDKNKADYTVLLNIGLALVELQEFDTFEEIYSIFSNDFGLNLSDIEKIRYLVAQKLSNFIGASSFYDEYMYGAIFGLIYQCDTSLVVEILKKPNLAPSLLESAGKMLSRLMTDSTVDSMEHSSFTKKIHNEAFKVVRFFSEEKSYSILSNLKQFDNDAVDKVCNDTLALERVFPGDNKNYFYQQRMEVRLGVIGILSSKGYFNKNLTELSRLASKKSNYFTIKMAYSEALCEVDYDPSDEKRFNEFDYNTFLKSLESDIIMGAMLSKIEVLSKFRTYVDTEDNRAKMKNLLDVLWVNFIDNGLAPRVRAKSLELYMSIIEDPKVPLDSREEERQKIAEAANSILLSVVNYEGMEYPERYDKLREFVAETLNTISVKENGEIYPRDLKQAVVSSAFLGRRGLLIQERMDKLIPVVVDVLTELLENRKIDGSNQLNPLSPDNLRTIDTLIGILGMPEIEKIALVDKLVNDGMSVVDAEEKMELRSNEALSALEILMENKNNEIRMSVFKAFINIGTEQALIRAEDMLSKEYVKDADRTEEMALALIATSKDENLILGYLVSRENELDGRINRFNKGYLNLKDVSIKKKDRGPIPVFGDIRNITIPQTVAVKKLLAIAQNRNMNTEIRMKAINVLVLLDDNGINNVFTELLINKDEEIAIRELISKSLSLSKDIGTQQNLFDIRENVEVMAFPELAEHIIRVVGKYWTDESVDALYSFISSDDKNIRLAAIESLGSINKDKEKYSEKLYVVMQNEEDADIRAAILSTINVIGEYDQNEIFTIAREWLTDNNRNEKEKSIAKDILTGEKSSLKDQILAYAVTGDIDAIVSNVKNADGLSIVVDIIISENEEKLKITAIKALEEIDLNKKIKLSGSKMDSTLGALSILALGASTNMLMPGNDDIGFESKVFSIEQVTNALATILSNNDLSWDVHKEAFRLMVKIAPDMLLIKILNREISATRSESINFLVEAATKLDLSKNEYSLRMIYILDEWIRAGNTDRDILIKIVKLLGQISRSSDEDTKISVKNLLMEALFLDRINSRVKEAIAHELVNTGLNDAFIIGNLYLDRTEAIIPFNGSFSEEGKGQNAPEHAMPLNNIGPYVKGMLQYRIARINNLLANDRNLNVSEIEKREKEKEKAIIEAQEAVEAAVVALEKLEKQDIFHVQIETQEAALEVERAKVRLLELEEVSELLLSESLDKAIKSEDTDRDFRVKRMARISKGDEGPSPARSSQVHGRVRHKANFVQMGFYFSMMIFLSYLGRLLFQAFGTLNVGVIENMNFVLHSGTVIISAVGFFMFMIMLEKLILYGARFTKNPESVTVEDLKYNIPSSILIEMLSGTRDRLRQSSTAKIPQYLDKDVINISNLDEIMENMITEQRDNEFFNVAGYSDLLSRWKEYGTRKFFNNFLNHLALSFKGVTGFFMRRVLLGKGTKPTEWPSYDTLLNYPALEIVYLNQKLDRSVILDVINSDSGLKAHFPDFNELVLKQNVVDNRDILSRLSLVNINYMVKQYGKKLFPRVALMETTFGGGAGEKLVEVVTSAMKTYPGEIDVFPVTDDNDLDGQAAMNNAIYGNPEGVDRGEPKENSSKPWIGKLYQYRGNIQVVSCSERGMNLGRIQRKVRMKPPLNSEEVQVIKKFYGTKGIEPPFFAELVDEEDRFTPLVLRMKLCVWESRLNSIRQQLMSRDYTVEEGVMPLQETAVNEKAERWGISIERDAPRIGQEYDQVLSGLTEKLDMEVSLKFLHDFALIPESTAKTWINDNIHPEARVRYMLWSFLKVYPTKDDFIKSEFRIRNIPTVMQTELRQVPIVKPSDWSDLAWVDYMNWHNSIQIGQTKSGFLFLGGTGNGFLWEMLAGNRLITKNGEVIKDIPMNQRVALQKLLSPLREQISKEETSREYEIRKLGLFERILRRMTLLIESITGKENASETAIRVPSELFRKYLTMYSQSGVWDPYNQIEDAELGSRLALYKLKATRLEGKFIQILEDELPKLGFKWWLQRSRWITLQTFWVILSFKPSFFMFFGQYIGFGVGWALLGSTMMIKGGLLSGVIGFVLGGYVGYKAGHLIYSAARRMGMQPGEQWQVDSIKGMGYEGKGFFGKIAGKLRGWYVFQHMSHLAGGSLAGIATVVAVLTTIIYLMGQAVIYAANIWDLSWTGNLGAMLIEDAAASKVIIEFLHGWLPTLKVGVIVFLMPAVILTVMAWIVIGKYAAEDEESTNEAIRIRMIGGISKLIGLKDLMEETRYGTNNRVIPLLKDTMDYSDDGKVLGVLELYKKLLTYNKEDNKYIDKLTDHTFLDARSYSSLPLIAKPSRFFSRVTDRRKEDRDIASLRNADRRLIVDVLDEKIEALIKKNTAILRERGDSRIINKERVVREILQEVNDLERGIRGEFKVSWIWGLGSFFMLTATGLFWQNMIIPAFIAGPIAGASLIGISMYGFDLLSRVVLRRPFLTLHRLPFHMWSYIGKTTARGLDYFNHLLVSSYLNIGRSIFAGHTSEAYWTRGRDDAVAPMIGVPPSYIDWKWEKWQYVVQRVSIFVLTLLLPLITILGLSFFDTARTYREQKLRTSYVEHSVVLFDEEVQDKELSEALKRVVAKFQGEDLSGAIAKGEVPESDIVLAKDMNTIKSALEMVKLYVEKWLEPKIDAMFEFTDGEGVVFDTNGWMVKGGAKGKYNGYRWMIEEKFDQAVAALDERISNSKGFQKNRLAKEKEAFIEWFEEKMAQKMAFRNFTGLKEKEVLTVDPEYFEMDGLPRQIPGVSDVIKKGFISNDDISAGPIGQIQGDHKGWSFLAKFDVNKSIGTLALDTREIFGNDLYAINQDGSLVLKADAHDNYLYDPTFIITVRVPEKFAGEKGLKVRPFIQSYDHNKNYYSAIMAEDLVEFGKVEDGYATLEIPINPQRMAATNGLRRGKYDPDQFRRVGMEFTYDGSANVPIEVDSVRIERGQSKAKVQESKAIQVAKKAAHPFKPSDSKGAALFAASALMVFSFLSGFFNALNWAELLRIMDVTITLPGIIFAFLGIYSLIAAISHYIIQKEVRNAIIDRFNVDPDIERFPTTRGIPTSKEIDNMMVAASDGYRDMETFKYMNKRTRKLIDIHEGFQGHIKGMFMMSPVFRWFTQAEYARAKDKAESYLRADSILADDIYASILSFDSSVRENGINAINRMDSTEEMIKLLKLLASEENLLDEDIVSRAIDILMQKGFETDDQEVINTIKDHLKNNLYIEGSFVEGDKVIVPLVIAEKAVDKISTFEDIEALRAIVNQYPPIEIVETVSDAEKWTFMGLNLSSRIMILMSRKMNSVVIRRDFDFLQALVLDEIKFNEAMKLHGGLVFQEAVLPTVKVVSEKENIVVVGIPAEVYQGLTPLEIEQLDLIPETMIAVLESLSEEGLMEELESARQNAGVKAAALVNVGADSKDLYSVIYSMVGELKSNIFDLTNPDIATLNKDTISKIENIEVILQQIAANLNWSKTIKSINISSLSLYQMRIEKSYDMFYEKPVKESRRVEYLKDILKEKEEHYLLHYIDGEAILTEGAKALIPAGIEIARRRQMMGVDSKSDRQYDRIMITLPESVKTDEEKLEFKNMIMSLWMLDGVLAREDIVLIERKDYDNAELFVLAQRSFKNVRRDNTGIRVVLGELEYSDTNILQVNLSPEAKTNINQYEVFVNLVLSKDKNDLIGIIDGLNNETGKLFIYLPKVEAYDLEAEVKNYYRYIQEILVRA